MSILNGILTTLLLIYIHKPTRLYLENNLRNKAYQSIFEGLKHFISINFIILILLAVYYLFSRIYIDPNEEIIRNFALLFDTSEEIYKDISTPVDQRYINTPLNLNSPPWGPLILYLNYLPMKLFGDSIFNTKIFNLISLVIFQYLIYLFCLVKTKNIKISFFFVGFISMILLSSADAVINIRNDAFSYLIIFSSLFLIKEKEELSNIKSIFFGLIIAILINLKPINIIALIPITFYLFFVNKKNYKWIILSIISFFIFNFIIWSKDNLSLTNYINLLFFISQNIEGYTFELFIKNFLFCFIWIIPISITIFIDWKRVYKEEKAFFLGLILASIFCSYHASRSGGGTADLFILIPSSIFLFIKSYQRKSIFYKDSFLGFNLFYLLILISIFLHSSTKGVLKKIIFLS